jgi:hypothetical protein
MNRTGIVLLLLTFLVAGAIAADEPVTSSVKVKFYGKIKADASFDDSRVSNGNYVQWVDPEDNAFQSTPVVKPRNDGKFNATARETRFGFDLSGPRVAGADLSGKLEVDFYGAAGANNKANIMLRHAYGKMDWADQDRAFTFGQTWDIVAPLNPSTLNYTVLWWTGNAGYRRPQFRYGQGFTAGSTKLLVEAGLFDNAGDSTMTNTTGGAAEAPTLQARVGATFPTWAALPTTVGLSAHVGEMRDNAAGSERAKTEAIYLDVKMPVLNWQTLMGEVYNGRNMQQFNGGAGWGLNGSTAGGANPDQEIGSTGYWLQGSMGPWNTLTINAGGGFDNPNENNMTAPTTGSRRIQNQCIFVNFLWKLSTHLTLGVELSNWQTKYMNSTRSTHNAKANRAQFSAIYSFY